MLLETCPKHLQLIEIVAYFQSECGQNVLLLIVFTLNQQKNNIVRIQYSLVRRLEIKQQSTDCTINLLKSQNKNKKNNNKDSLLKKIGFNQLNYTVLLYSTRNLEA
eukprot:TRINITY_DN4376_c0_g2_i2.p3 TRINITY_DN4376_c0_g2~~TRINITY_DN4376_c0_g2_i2.p3  ORF type:complete len:106 (+),score=3.92 TRINITY_DN4376_c0_g2_i2:413-730(+)